MGCLLFCGDGQVEGNWFTIFSIVVKLENEVLKKEVIPKSSPYGIEAEETVGF